MKLLRLLAVCMATTAMIFPAKAAYDFNGHADNETDSLGYYYIITGGKFPTGNIPNGDNASGGTIRWLSDDPTWGNWSLPIQQWHKDDWFSDNAGFALTLMNGNTIVYDNNGIEDGSYGDYYNGDGSHGIHGLYRGYSMANNYDWIYASYFRLDQETTFDTIIGYFDANGGSSDPVPFDPNSPLISYRMNIWSAYQDNPSGNTNSWMPAVASFTGDTFSSDNAPGCFSVSDTGVKRVWASYDGWVPDPIWRVVYKLAQPVTLEAGVYFFSHDAVVSCPITSGVSVDPNPVALNGTATLTAIVDDSTTGNSEITNAEYSLNGGDWVRMNVADGGFDSATENVTAKFSPSSFGITDAGIYTVYVRGEDADGNIGKAQCVQVVVYDPSAGFVTGGGWINSPKGAYVGPDAFQAVWDQSFDGDTTGWFDANSGWYGTITAEPDGTALVEGDSTSAPFSRFDGYHSTWPGTWVADIDVYLDPNWAAGEGFDYSVSASKSDGSFLRDFIFHVGVVDNYGPITGKALLVNADNNSYYHDPSAQDYFTVNPYVLVNANGGHYYTVTTAGWYTLQHVFHDAGGYLAVDLKLLDANGTVVWSVTRSNVADTIPGVVGGNRYAWFTFDNVTGGFNVDNHERFANAPTYPTGKATFGFVSKYQKGTSVPTGSTEFVFKAGDLNFHSTSYDWLIVTGSNYARYKGHGTINGENAPNGQPYQFMIWAGDGTGTDGADTFRIKIFWDDGSTENVVYDNGMDEDIASGNIIVHTSK